MTYNRKIRFEYYEIVARKVGETGNCPDIKFDFQKWIYLVEKFSLEGRTYDYYAERARLDKIKYSEKDSYWFLNFIRLRETNIPNTAYIDKEAEPIDLDDDEFIGEAVNSIYDISTGVLMLQRNKFSLGADGLEKYINLVWKEQEGISIFIRPIIKKDILATILKKGTQYRKFVIRFSDIKDKNICEGKASTFKKFFDSLTEYGAVNAQISITIGNKNEGSLDSQTIQESIDVINENKHIISNAEIGIKYDNEPVEILDLFSDILHDFIVFKLEKKTSLVSEYVELEMIKKFNIKKGEIINNIKRE